MRFQLLISFKSKKLQCRRQSSYYRNGHRVLKPDPKKSGYGTLTGRDLTVTAIHIMENQDILILDEPMNGLDNQGVNDVRNILLELKEEGKTVILASHNKEDIEILCDTVYEMEHGRLV